MEMKEIREWKEGGNVIEIRNYGMDGWIDWKEKKREENMMKGMKKWCMKGWLDGWKEGNRNNDG